MGYNLRADEPVAAGIRRVVCEQIDRAIEDLTDKEVDRHTSVHQARKRFKQIRAVLRLVRPELGHVYRAENRWFRDVGRRLSAARDAQVLVETFDTLRGTFDDQMAPDAFSAVRTLLVERRDALTANTGELEHRVVEVVADLRRASQRVAAWPLTTNGFAALRPGLEHSYRAGRSACAEAYNDPTPEHFHEWRKRVKDHWYHSRLLKRIWPKLMHGYRDSLADLADVLGADHDLSVLRQTLLDRPEAFDSDRDLQALLGLLDRRQAELRVTAEPLGRRIFTEKPKVVSKRMGRYWAIWRAEEQRSAVLK